MIKKVSVHASKNYDILIGENMLAEVGPRILDIHKPCKVLLVSDHTVNDLYGFPVGISLQLAGYEVYHFGFPIGEESKCLNTIYDIVDFLASEGFTRTDLIVALGGGIVGDVAGFAASIYQRGIEFVQIPTTLLAAVDSSVGGKTGVNLEAGKNMIGAFWQPSLVICDCNVFKTLPYEVFLDGIAEAIKYGCITDKSLCDLLKSEGRNLYDTLSPSKYMRSDVPTGCTNTGIILSSDEDINPNSIVDLVDSIFAFEDRTDEETDTDTDPATSNEMLMQIIERCVQIKADIVAQDERDTGIRQLLNFGHTFGHAIEKVSQYEISHGHAVAMGMLIVARACAKQGLCAEECAQELESVLTEFGFATDLLELSEFGFATSLAEYECEFRAALSEPDSESSSVATDSGSDSGSDSDSDSDGAHPSAALLEDALIDAAQKDKKRAGQDITLVVPKTIGECRLHKIPVEQLSKFISIS